MLLLSPNVKNAEQDLTHNLNAMFSVTGWVHALVDSVLMEIEPEPDWFPSFKQKFTQMKTDAQNLWVDILYPKVIADVPQSLLTFNEMFQPAATQLANVVQAIEKNEKSQPTDKQREDLVAILTTMLHTTTDLKQTQQSIEQEVHKYLTSISNNHNTLVEAAKKIAKLVQADENKVNEIKEKISNIQLQLAKANTKADAATLKTGKAIFSTIISFTFGLAISGGVLSLASIGSAVMSIGGAVTSEVLNTEEIEKDLNQIYKLSCQLSDEELQVTSLKGVLGTVEQLVKESENSQDAMRDISRLWEQQHERIEQVLEILKQPVVDVSLISQLTHLEQAKKEWNDLSDFAKAMQSISLESGKPIQFSEKKISNG